jgi:hypothetical protein
MKVRDLLKMIEKNGWYQAAKKREVTFSLSIREAWVVSPGRSPLARDG